MGSHVKGRPRGGYGKIAGARGGYGKIAGSSHVKGRPTLLQTDFASYVLF